MGVIQNRSELVFLYDIKDANPNGDPLDKNKPRIDEETGINLVTDVRLKRTIRDYFFEYKGYNGEEDKDIFVRDIYDDDKHLQSGKARAKNFEESPEKILENCVDVRLFGGVIPLSNSSITYTGPVQFQMGRSFHPVELKFIKGTGAFASGAKKKNKTFREEYVVPYSLIGFYGVVNENAGQETNLTEEDVELLLEGMWKGTKNLISRSKVGQTPRLLLQVEYSEENFFIGELKDYIKLVSDKRDEQIRDVSDYELEVSALLNIIEDNRDKIKTVRYKTNPRVSFVAAGEEIDLGELDMYEKIEF